MILMAQYDYRNERCGTTKVMEDLKFDLIIATKFQKEKG